jgi:hypothetical protein
MDAAIREIMAELNAYYSRLARWEALRDAPSPPTRPTPVDPRALAEKHGFEFGTVPLSDPLDVDQYELGQASSFSFAGGQVRQVTFAELAYGPHVALYEPSQIRSFINDEEFVYWAVQHEPEHVPSFDEVREQVVQAWTVRQAAEIAMKEAEQWAQQARKANQPLAEVFSDKADQILRPEPFSFMTTGSLPQMGGFPHLSSVEGVEFAGRELMRSIFDLEPGEVAVAADQPRQTLFVARLVEHTPPLDQLRNSFLERNYAASDRDPTMFIAFQEKNEIFGGWYEELEKEKKVEWLRPARQIGRS